MDNRRFSVLEVILLVILSLAFICSVTIYAVRLSEFDIAKYPADFGIFGDYIGGVVGTLVGLISIIFLYRAYRIQVDVAAKQEAKQDVQQFEVVYFSLLNQQRDILQSMEGEIKDIHGRSRVEHSTQYMVELKDNLMYRLLELSYEPSLFKNERKHILKERVNDIYYDLYKNHSAQLGHYFRHLYHLIKYVDAHAPADPKSYIDLVQAQMCNAELYMTAVNGISRFGRKRMLPLLNEYSFLENLLTEQGDIMPDLIKIYYPKTKCKKMMERTSNIIFLAGIHGVGKSKFVDDVKKRFSRLNTLSCSTLLDWKDSREKEVDDVQSNQELLIGRVNELIDVDELYLLDGHFCLMNSSGEIEFVGTKILEAMNPALLILLEEDPVIIQSRLKKRDGKKYEVELLNTFLQKERDCAKEYAKSHDINLIIESSSDTEKTYEAIGRYYETYY